MIIEKKRFGTADGAAVMKYRIRNKNGMVLSLISYGAAMTGLTAPDRNGNFGDVLLGYEDLDGYVQNDGCMGACVGRYANRIAGAAFELDGREYRLTQNEGKNCLHGGRGWSRRVFESQTGENSVEFFLNDREGDGRLPRQPDGAGKIHAWRRQLCGDRLLCRIGQRHDSEHYKSRLL